MPPVPDHYHTRNNYLFIIIKSKKINKTLLLSFFFGYYKSLICHSYKPTYYNKQTNYYYLVAVENVDEPDYLLPCFNKLEQNVYDLRKTVKALKTVVLEFNETKGDEAILSQSSMKVNLIQINKEVLVVHIVTKGNKMPKQ